MSNAFESLAAAGDALGRFQPEYWGGVELGQGSPEPWADPETDKQSQRIATDSLAGYLLAGRPVPPASLEQSYRAGDSFAAEALAPGTLLWIHQEDLMTTEPATPLPIRVEGIKTVPPRSDMPLTYRLGHYLYRSTTYWGMVSATRRGNPLLYQIQSEGVERSSGDKLTFSETISAVRSRFVVGEVCHEGDADVQRAYRVLGVSVAARARGASADHIKPPDSEGRVRVRDLLRRQPWRPRTNEF